jgi:hypothetical protein
LWGGADDDILVGGRTTYQDEATSVVNYTALNALLSEWVRATVLYPDRIAHLQSGGGLNGTYRLNADTVFADGLVAWLWGESERDWFLADSADQTPDWVASGAEAETKTLIG